MKQGQSSLRFTIWRGKLYNKAALENSFQKPMNKPVGDIIGTWFIFFFTVYDIYPFLKPHIRVGYICYTGMKINYTTVHFWVEGK